ncbi:hypothetical protein [uncultured Rubinisphaera sp.]|uniref:hypothetical protein n=1 Tax=uncultured Rubinisphaera sp. TaxID=1678686 RepID=UPI0030D8F903
MKSAQNSSSFFSINEFVAKTGMSLSTVHRRIRGGDIQTYQPGGPKTRILIPAEELNTSYSHRSSTESALLYDRPQTANKKRGPKPRWQNN